MAAEDDRMSDPPTVEDLLRLVRETAAHLRDGRIALVELPRVPAAVRTGGEVTEGELRANHEIDPEWVPICAVCARPVALNDDEVWEHYGPEED